MKRLLILVAGLMLCPGLAGAATVEETVAQLQKDWAIAKYETPDKDREQVFEKLTRAAEAAVTAHPGRAEPLIWQAIIVSSDAGENGGFSALGKVKKARDLLLEAEKINAHALDGSVYTSLGSLYYQVPGWPLGFGDDVKAEGYLKRALSINPDGIDPNFFYGDFLREAGRHKEAVQYLEKALKAPPRPDRPLADKGRHTEVERALAEVKQELGG